MYYSILWKDLGGRMTVVEADSESAVKEYVSNKKGAGKAIITRAKSGDIEWYGKERIGKIYNGKLHI